MEFDAGFEAYVHRQGGALLRFAVTLTGDTQQAEEIVQEVLLRAFARWSSIGAMDRPHAYVRRMVVNEHLSWRRRWSRIEPRADIEVLDVAVDHADTNAERTALVAQIRRLPRRQRAVLAMRYYEDLPDAEIADVLGCSPATVRSIAARALAKLRVQLTDPANPATATNSQEPVR